MKKITALFGSVVVMGACIASTAGAETPRATAPSPAATIAINPAVLGQFVAFAWVKGTVKVNPGLATGVLAGLSCSDIIVTAQSQAMNPPPPGGLFSSPKWSHHVAATGSFASGTCSYSIAVPPGSAFGVSASGVGPGATGAIKCYYLPMGFSPAQAGWFTVPVGGTKEQDFTLTSVACANAPT